MTDTLDSIPDEQPASLSPQGKTEQGDNFGFQCWGDYMKPLPEGPNLPIESN